MFEIPELKNIMNAIREHLDSEDKFNTLPNDVKSKFLEMRDELDVFLLAKGFKKVESNGYRDKVEWEGHLLIWKKEDLIILFECQVSNNENVGSEKYKIYLRKITKENEMSSDFEVPLSDCFSLDQHKEAGKVVTNENFVSEMIKKMSTENLSLILDTQHWSDDSLD